MGEKPSNGYYIEVEKVNIDDNNNVEVIVKETEHKKTRDSVLMLITYPICSLEFSSCPNEIVIKNTDGEEFSFVNYN